MKLKKAILALTVLLALSGCVAVPVGPAYDYGYYPTPVPYYYGPAYYGPSIGIGIYGGGRHHHWR